MIKFLKYLAFIIWCIFLSCLLQATDEVYDSPIYQKFVLVDKDEEKITFKNELGTFEYHTYGNNDAYFNSFKKIAIGKRFSSTKEYNHLTLYEMAVDAETENNISKLESHPLASFVLSEMALLLFLGYSISGITFGLMFLIGEDTFKCLRVWSWHGLVILILYIIAIN